MTNHDNNHGDAHAHHHHHRSARQRLSRIAGQLGGALVSTGAPARRDSSDSSNSSNSGSSNSNVTTTFSSNVPHTSSASTPPPDRLTSISRTLTGVMSLPTRPHTSSSLRGGTANTPNPHLTTSSHSSSSHPPPPRRLPRFRDLPAEGGFPGCAWNVWGPGDTLGTLNLLDAPTRARAAREEIRSGVCISVSWPMHLPLYAAFGRSALVHRAWGKRGKYYQQAREAVVRARDGSVEDRSDPRDPSAAAVSDDEIALNPQAGSQWDGFAHFGHLTLDVFYGGRKRADVQGYFEAARERAQVADANADAPREMTPSPPPPLSISSWSHRGIAGRGVLLDIYGFLSRNNADRAPYDPFTSHAITLEDIRNCARAQGVVFRPGDVLLLRTGWIHRYTSATDAERRDVAVARHGYVGVEQGEHVCEWLWDTHFAAVASDAPAFERWPCPPGQTHLHETLLALFGMPIGEMFDLEAVTRECQRTRRWTFYFSSWPLNNVGGVASLANAGVTF